MPKRIITIIGFSCLSLPAVAQHELAPEFGIGTGLAVYQGDLSLYRFGSFNKADLSFTLFGQLPIRPRLSVHAAYAFAALQESDRSYSTVYRPHRNFSFKTLVNEFSLQVVFSPLASQPNEEANRLSPYVFAGAGYAFLRIERDWKNFDHGWKHWPSWVRSGLAKDSAAQLPASTLTLPVGLGIRYRVGENFSLFAELSHRFNGEEYLDGFSKACNPLKSDSFTTFTAGVVFQRAFSSFQGAKWGRW